MIFTAIVFPQYNEYKILNTNKNGAINANNLRQENVKENCDLLNRRKQRTGAIERKLWEREEGKSCILIDDDNHVVELVLQQHLWHSSSHKI